MKKQREKNIVFLPPNVYEPSIYTSAILKLIALVFQKYHSLNYFILFSFLFFAKVHDTMMPSNLFIVQLCMIVLVMVTYSTTAENSQSLDGKVHSHKTEVSVFPFFYSYCVWFLIQQQHNDHSKQALANTDDDDESETSESNEEYFNDYHQHWPDMVNKRYAKKNARAGNSATNGGDNRLWAIPYRFGKRSAMPYRFGKRAAMHFRLGKKSASV